MDSSDDWEGCKFVLKVIAIIAIFVVSVVLILGGILNLAAKF